MGTSVTRGYLKARPEWTRIAVTSHRQLPGLPVGVTVYMVAITRRRFCPREQPQARNFVWRCIWLPLSPVVCECLPSAGHTDLAALSSPRTAGVARLSSGFYLCHARCSSAMHSSNRQCASSPLRPSADLLSSPKLVYQIAYYHNLTLPFPSDHASISHIYLIRSTPA